MLNRLCCGSTNLVQGEGGATTFWATTFLREGAPILKPESAKLQSPRSPRMGEARIHSRPRLAGLLLELRSAGGSLLCLRLVGLRVRCLPRQLLILVRKPEKGDCLATQLLKSNR